MTALGALLTMQLNHRTPDDVLRQLATGDDAQAAEALRMLKARARAGEQVVPDLCDGFVQRLCVRCDAILSDNHPTNTCPRCSPQP